MASLYYYTARDVRGAFIRGAVEAGDASAALSTLRTRALFVTSLESGGGSRAALAAAFQLGGVSTKTLATFFRSFSTLVGAGVAMRRALEVTIDACNDMRLREALRGIVCEVENGLSLSEAMTRRPNEFPRLFVAMIRSGELGGVLDEVLERIAGIVERDHASRKRVAAALTYPLVVAFAAIGLVLFLITTIVPMFRSMYEQMHVPLPPITAALITLAAVLQSPLAWTAGGFTLLTVLYGVMRLRRSQRSAVLFETIVSYLPVAGAIARKSALARLSRTLGTLLRSGVGLIAALEVVTDVVASVRYRESICGLRRALRAGSLISDHLAATGIYDPLFLQLLRVGEETGTLDGMLLRIADYYDLDVETMLSALGSTLEPAMILLLGGAVGFIVAAIFIPLYTLIGNMK